MKYTFEYSIEYTFEYTIEYIIEDTFEYTIEYTIEYPIEYYFVLFQFVVLFCSYLIYSLPILFTVIRYILKKSSRNKS